MSPPNTSNMPGTSSKNPRRLRQRDSKLNWHSLLAVSSLMALHSLIFVRPLALLGMRPVGKGQAVASPSPLSPWGHFPIFTGVCLSHTGRPPRPCPLRGVRMLTFPCPHRDLPTPQLSSTQDCVAAWRPTVTVGEGIAPPVSASKPCVPVFRHTAPQ